GRREAELLNARRSGERRLVAGLTGLLHLSFLQILLGALTAGIDAGRAFPTWPKMGDGWLPPDPFMLEPLWRNFFEDAGLVEFVHRIGAYLVLALAIYVWMRGRRSAQDYTRSAVHVMLAFVVLQAALGIFTALYSAPLSLGILHQFGALLLWVQILRARYYARYPVQQTIKGAS
ncbi:MAG: COX15/CtaA family protein, partial [Rhodobacteraceae bacterium]|nr:COX15/CtaA family protein [Paracoccaceae bacterium]